MPRLSASQAQFLTTLYQKVKAGSLTWVLRGADSHEAFLGDYRIHVDRTGSGRSLSYVIWVFDKELDVLDRITSSEVEDESLPAIELSGSEAIRQIYGMVALLVEDRLADVVEKLKGA